MEEGASDRELPYNVRNYLDVNDSKHNSADLKKRTVLSYLKDPRSEASLRQEGSYWGSVDVISIVSIHFLALYSGLASL